MVISSFYSMKWPGVFSPWDWMLVHRRVTPSMQIAGTHLGGERLWELYVFSKSKVYQLLY